MRRVHELQYMQECTKDELLARIDLLYGCIDFHVGPYEDVVSVLRWTVEDEIMAVAWSG